VGLYTSPHLVRFTERFRINGRDMAEQRAARLTGDLMEAVDPREPPTFFEAATAMALIYFAAEEVDVALMEVGMGGRLDATNVIRPAATAITNISLDHREFLGSRLLDVACEKAGIIKEGVPLATAATQPQVLDLFESICKREKASFFRVGRDFRYRSRGSRLDYYGLVRNFSNLELGLEGDFQSRNAALALGLIELLGDKVSVSDAAILEGMKKISWPGRMHRISESPTIILDGAHNPGAVRELARSVKRLCGRRRVILILGVMGDKDIRGIVRGIAPLAAYTIFSRPEYSRAADPEKLMKAAAFLGKPGEALNRLSQAVERAKSLAGPEDVILITGSLFTVGEALTLLAPEKFGVKVE